MIKDPHDPRPFRRWVSLNDDSSVNAVHEVVADRQPAQLDTLACIEVTTLPKQDWFTAKLPAEAVAAAKATLVATQSAKGLDRVPVALPPQAGPKT